MCDFHNNNVAGFGCSVTRASVQDVASVQDQNEDVSFGGLETLLGRTILQVKRTEDRQEGNRKQG